MIDIKRFIDTAMNASDLMQGYVDHVIDSTECVPKKDHQALIKAVKGYKPKSAEEAGAKAIILFTLGQK